MYVCMNMNCKLFQRCHVLIGYDFKVKYYVFVQLIRKYSTLVEYTHHIQCYSSSERLLRLLITTQAQVLIITLNISGPEKQSGQVQFYFEIIHSFFRPVRDFLPFNSSSSYTGTVFGLATVCISKSSKSQEKRFIVSNIKLDLRPSAYHVQI